MEQHLGQLELDDQVVAAIEKYRLELESDALLQELGITVTFQQAALAALRRGLTRGTKPASRAEPARGPRTEARTEARAEEPGEQEGYELLEADENGRRVLPDGWMYWSNTERIPDEQADYHAHYSGLGWTRLWGKAGTGETYVFYMPLELTVEGREVEWGAQPPDENVVVQQTPYGPGHIVSRRKASMAETGAR